MFMEVQVRVQQKVAEVGEGDFWAVEIESEIEIEREIGKEMLGGQAGLSEVI